VRRRLLVTYLLLTLVVLIALELPLAISYRDKEIRTLESNLERDAFVISSYVEHALLDGDTATMAAVVTNYFADTEGRVVIVDANGRSVADSDPTAALGRDFSDRPEFTTALDGGVAIGSRYSTTLGTGLVYATVPVNDATTTIGAVRVSYSTGQMDARVQRYWAILAGAGLVTLAVAGLIGILLARWVSAPLTELQHAARRFGAGELDARADEGSGPPEVRDLAAAFNATSRRLEQLLTAQQQFVADASHQLRTPLTALRLRLEMIELDADEQMRDDLEGARHEVQRLSRLVDGLLALARAERTASTATESIDLDELLDDRANAWQPLATERGATIEVRHGGLRAHCTPDHVTQSLDNLIANALEVTPVGGTVALTTNVATSEPRTIAIHVADQGPGMTAEQRDRAFDRFWRAEGATAELGGSGLGLAIVRKLSEADGGHAELHDADDGGLDAVIVLPG